MQRMSEPQIVVLFVRTSTSPWPGVGTSKLRRSTVLFPGRTAPCIRVGLSLIGASRPAGRDSSPGRRAAVWNVRLAPDLEARWSGRLRNRLGGRGRDEQAV